MSDVTIVIPVYCDTEEKLIWLDECFKSVMSQGCEVVAFDDGSTVNTIPVISKYIKRYGFSKTNRGVSFARNECVKLARTPLIYPLDCDDKLRPGAISTLEKLWKGVPIYSDMSKFGLVTDPHYELMNFHCDLITQYVGFTTVNVLHSVEQYYAIGGWDTLLDFYEDGEYNARLFARFCGYRHAEPLVEYRIHSTQRTKRYAKNAAEYATRILERIRSLDMACTACGKRRSSVSNAANISNAAKSSPLITTNTRGTVTEVLIGESYRNVPLEFDGKVLALYVGGEGKMKHYYQGQGSKQSYKVRYGDHIYADPRDVRDAAATSDTRMLIRVMRREEQPVVTVTPQKVEVAPLPQPIEVPEMPKIVYDLPDIVNMTLSDLKDTPLDGVDIPALIRMEARGKNRKQIIEWLKKRV